MPDVDIVEQLTKNGLKVLDQYREKKLVSIRKTGQGAVDLFRIPQNDDFELSKIRNLIKSGASDEIIINAVSGLVNASTGNTFKPLVNTMRSYIVERGRENARMTSERIDAPRGEVLSTILHNANSRIHLYGIDNGTLRISEKRVLIAVLKYLDGDFTINEKLWDSLSRDSDNTVRAIAANFHARELSRNGLAAQAIKVLFLPHSQSPDRAAVFSASMALNLELQDLNVDGEINKNRISEKISLSKEIFKNYADGADIDQLDNENESHKNFDIFVSGYGIAHAYLMFNYFLLKSILDSDDSERLLNIASTISRRVGEYHKIIDTGVREPQAKVVLRMFSLIANVADLLASQGKCAQGDVIRDIHLEGAMLENNRLLQNFADIEGSIDGGLYIREPALQAPVLLLGEMDVCSEFPRNLQHRRDHFRQLVREMRLARKNPNFMMIPAFARSCDFTVEKLDGVHRHALPEINNAENFRLYVSRRIHD